MPSCQLRPRGRRRVQVCRLREGGLMVARCSVGAVALPGEGKCLELKAGPEGSTTSSNEALVFINETVRCVRVRVCTRALARLDVEEGWNLLKVPGIPFW